MVADGEDAADGAADDSGRGRWRVGAAFDGVPDVVEVVAERIEAESSLLVEGLVCGGWGVVVAYVVVAEGLVAFLVECCDCRVVDVVVGHQGVDEHDGGAIWWAF